MEVVNIDVEHLIGFEVLKRKYEILFLKNNALFYKVLNSKKIISIDKLRELKEIESKIDLLGSFNMFELKHVCLPKQKLYCNGQFVGYATKYLQGYVDFIASIQHADSCTKIRLLKEISQTIKNLHEHGLAHTDIYSDNVMCNGSNIKLIDFDECTVFENGNLLPYCSAPQADIAAINNLILRTLKIDFRKKNSIIFPKEIRRYISSFDINSEANCFSDVRACVPDIYPHDWIDDIDYAFQDKAVSSR